MYIPKLSEEAEDCKVLVALVRIKEDRVSKEFNDITGWIEAKIEKHLILRQVIDEHVCMMIYMLLIYYKLYIMICDVYFIPLAHWQAWEREKARICCTYYKFSSFKNFI